MNDRERFVACLTGQPLDRPPHWVHWGPWGTTWEIWKRQGLPAEFPDFGDIQRHFGTDLWPQAVPVLCGPCPRFEQQTLHEDEHYRTWIDTWGIRRRNPKDNESMSEFLAFPVRNRQDWLAYQAERLDPDDPRRLASDWLAKAQDWMRRGVPVQLGYYPDVGIFGSVRWLLGDEECLIAFIEQPDLVHEIMRHMTDVYLSVFAKVMAAGVRVDVIHIWEDMCGRQGPLISPRMWREFMGPCYRRIRRFADEHGIPLLSVDTDGKPDLIVEPMMEAGVNYIYPWEVAAGCDINQVRAQWPTLGLMGGIDKRVLTHGRPAIDWELERIRPAMEKGRYIPELDHLIPSDVRWEEFFYFCERKKKLVGKA